MVKKINILLLLLLFISVSAVSAADDINGTISDETLVIEDNSPDVLSCDSGEEILSANVHTVNKTNYLNYFSTKGELVSTSVKDGDTINIDGDFSGNNFTFRKAVNIVGTGKNKLKNSVFTFYGGASGSNVSNLNIFNTKGYSYGIFLNGASNCLVQNCFINNTGVSSYAICVANNANYNNITNNDFHTYGITYGHGTRSTYPLLVSGAHYNYIANNIISCDDANGIYLSSYGGGPLNGGLSNFNTIYNNTVKYNVLPTSWSYGIQVMGGNNKIDSNKVIGGYRGISTSSGFNNVIINNYIINMTGADYNTPDVESGAENAIIGTYNSIIKNNTIINARLIPTGAGISALDNSIVEYNKVQLYYNGTGIHPQGSNISISNNEIYTVSGSAVLYDSDSYNLYIINNFISTKNAVGILIQKVNDKGLPGNITIVGNYIYAGNHTTGIFAIDAKDADNSTNNVIENNQIPKGYGDIRSPSGVYIASKPVYNFNGTSYEVTPSTYFKFFQSNGALNADIKTGDILNFNGEFNNKKIIINSGIKINGENAKFNNCTFKVYNNCVWLENLVIKNNNYGSNAWGILVYSVVGSTILNCDISVQDLNAAYAIYIVDSSDIDVINNSISSTGSYLTYTLLAYRVTECNFINNTIYTNGTGKSYIMSGMSTCIDGVSCLDGNENCLDGNENCLDGNENCLDGNENCLDGDVFKGNHQAPPEVYRTYGILLLFSSDNVISGNKINATSQLNKTFKTNESTNSVIGIDLYFNCHNNIVNDNVVYVKANDNYIYGVGVLGSGTGSDAAFNQGASNNQFCNNEIILEGTYFVEGIVIGYESVNTLIVNNNVYAKSSNVAYGINLEMSQKSIIKENLITLCSDVDYGIEVFASNDNIIKDNEFECNAKQGYGLLLSNSKNNEIISNIIINNFSGEYLDFNNHDSISGGFSGVNLVANSSNNIIVDNNISSTKGFAINLGEISINNNISDNYLDSEKGFANRAVNNSNDKNTISDNYKYVLTGELDDLTINYLESGEIVFHTDVDGVLVKFYVDGYIGNSTSSNGVATFKYKFDDTFTPTRYALNVIASKEDYSTKEFTSILYVEKGNYNLLAKDAVGYQGNHADLIVSVFDVDGNPVSDVEVKFNLNGRTFAKSVKTNSSGIGISDAEIQDNPGNYKLTAVIAESDYFNEASMDFNLEVRNSSATKIDINSKLYSSGVLAVLKDNNGVSIANKKVTITLNGKLYYTNTTAKGEIILPAVSRGSYDVSVAFKGETIYRPSESSAKITVLPSITGNKAYSVYYGNAIKYKVRIKGSDGKYVGANKIVTVKVNGKTYNVRTDKNGYATKSISLKTGSYTITAQYNGDKVSNKITIKPTLIAKNIVKKKAKTIKFSVKLVNKKGKILKNKKITFKVKGKKYTAKTNKKGVATVSLKNLKVGKNIVTSSYGGCTISNKITVKK